jgi:hypothetical protein
MLVLLLLTRMPMMMMLVLTLMLLLDAFDDVAYAAADDGANNDAKMPNAPRHLAGSLCCAINVTVVVDVDSA